MRADIADALIARGNVARAALVLQRQGQLFVKEGWWDLAAAVLQRLLHCQKLLMQVRPHTVFDSSSTIALTTIRQKSPELHETSFRQAKGL